MNKYISWIAIGLALVAVAIAVVGGNNQPVLGTTRFPNDLQIGRGTVATTTLITGRLCIKTLTVGSGSDFLYYFPATSTGNGSVSGWATSTTACN